MSTSHSMVANEPDAAWRFQHWPYFRIGVATHGSRIARRSGRPVAHGARDWRRMSALKALLCVDGAAPDRLLELVVPLLAELITWVPTHIVDLRGRRDLGFLSGSIRGAGPLTRTQQQAIESATAEHTHAILAA